MKREERQWVIFNEFLFPSIIAQPCYCWADLEAYDEIKRNTESYYEFVHCYVSVRAFYNVSDLKSLCVTNKLCLVGYIVVTINSIIITFNSKPD